MQESDKKLDKKLSIKTAPTLRGSSTIVFTIFTIFTIFYNYLSQMFIYF